MTKHGIAHLHASISIIRCFVIVVLQSQTLEQKTRVWLCKTIMAFVDKNVMAEISAQSSVSSLRSLSVHLNPQSLLDLTTLVEPSLTVVSVAAMRGTVASLQRPRVLTVTSLYQTRKNAGNMHWTCSYSLCGEKRKEP